MNRTLTGTLLALASAGSYAFFPIFTKMALQSGIATYDALSWRFILASAVIWITFPLWRKQARLGTLTRRDLLALLGLGALFSMGALAAFLALERVSATNYTMLFYSYPTMVALLSLVLGERLPLSAWLAVGLALVGCALTAGAELVIETPVDVALPLINAVIVAVYFILVGRWTGHINGLASSFLIMTTACLIFLAGGAVLGLGAPATLGGWLAVLGTAVFATVVGPATIVIGITYIGAARASILSTLGPPLTVILAALMLGDHTEPIQYVGGALILASVLLLQVKGRGKPIPLEPEAAVGLEPVSAQAEDTP